MRLALSAFVSHLLAASVHARSTEIVSVSSLGAAGNYDSSSADVSAEGRYVVFQSDANTLVPGDTNLQTDIFVRDRLLGVTTRVSVAAGGVQGNGSSFDAVISSDGRFVAFQSTATNLVPGDSNGKIDTFLCDLISNTIERISLGNGGTQQNSSSVGVCDVTPGGRYVAFTSGATNLVASDTNPIADAFVRDRVLGVTTIESQPVGGGDLTQPANKVAISADGRYVVFDTSAHNVIPGVVTGASYDVYRHDRVSGTMELVSVSSLPLGTPVGGGSREAAISADGRYVAWWAGAAWIVPDDNNGHEDVFVRDMAAGVTTMVSRTPSGGLSNGGSDNGSITADGRYVTFQSYATDLVVGDTNGLYDVFRHDRFTGTTARISLADSGAQATKDSHRGVSSDDGSVVVFDTLASSLVANDLNNRFDVFARVTNLAAWTNSGAGWPGTNGVPVLSLDADPVIGSTPQMVIGNSSGTLAAAILLLGVQSSTTATPYGGALLLNPILSLSLVLPAGSTQLPAAVPNDPSLSSAKIHLQVLEADSGASKGVSFTPRLTVVLGN